MRIGYAAIMAALLVSAPAMAQVIIGGDNDGARRHEYRADQDRAEGRQDMNQARQDAARGDYRDAAREQADARRDWHDARRQENDASRDDSGVRIQLGH